MLVRKNVTCFVKKAFSLACFHTFICFYTARLLHEYVRQREKWKEMGGWRDECIVFPQEETIYQ